ncbi:hypothetical protein QWY20_14520 [Alkalimonas sp. MEB108]|uniref:Uncharacterized protein n=1 Tax=Alkalimonas cellulosilytica TaxID=3058395 RepID=A0ABU7J7Z2_9GAMM|nr:hypothetical protein [Alkalimonas sp. MEB108]MEE2002671.1 hypothetical protein [Alkalimonas sp. MEB108]
MKTSLTTYMTGILMLSSTGLPVYSAEVAEQSDLLEQLRQQIHQDIRQQFQNHFEELKQRTQLQLQQSVTLVLPVMN